jgi:hypothetical protein
LLLAVCGSHDAARLILNLLTLAYAHTQEIRFYIDFKQDESYTPSTISIRAGTNAHDLKVTNTSAELLMR